MSRSCRSSQHRVRSVALLGVLATLSVAGILVSTPASADGWKKQSIHERFYAEGASAGDLDGDGHIDLVAGPMWLRGPEFADVFTIESPREVAITSYSDHFFSSVFDANQDGANDILVLGFPGKAARLYLNPGFDHESGFAALSSVWEVRKVADVIDNESPAVIDIVGDELPEIVCGREGRYGY
ncbi:MAG: VCBS repeat-containing protein [Planctomycetota bacterium]